MEGNKSFGRVSAFFAGSLVSSLAGASVADISAGKSVAQLVLWSLYFLCFCYYYGARAAAFRKSALLWGMAGGLLSVAILLGIVLAVTLFAELYDISIKYGVVFGALLFAVGLTVALARLLISQRDHPLIFTVSLVSSVALLFSVYPAADDADIEYEKIPVSSKPVSSQPAVAKRTAEAPGREKGVEESKVKDQFPPTFGKVRSTAIKPGEESTDSSVGKADIGRSGSRQQGSVALVPTPPAVPDAMRQGRQETETQPPGRNDAAPGSPKSDPATDLPVSPEKASRQKEPKQAVEDDLIARIITNKQSENSKSGFSWVVQVASFTKRSNAFSLRDKLKQNGFKVFIAPGSSASRYRVRIGPVVTRTEADNLRLRLAQQHKLKGIVLKYR